MSISIACIGSGNMGNALMKSAASVDGVSVGFTDVDRTRAEEAARLVRGSVFISNTDAVQGGDFIFLAVKPQVLGAVLSEIASAVRERLAGTKPPVLVSMAPGWSIAKIQEALGVKAPVVRIMPNTPALVSQGVIVISPSADVQSDNLTVLERILAAAGIVDRLDEKYLDAVTGLSGSGPAFVYLFIEALSDGGVRAGLPRDKALRYAAQTVLGAAAMVKETGKHPGELKDMVCSPGGTTITGVAALENGAFRGMVMNAVEAAFKRSAELG